MKSLDDMEIEIQEDFIKAIKKSVTSELIRFWEPRERISDDELDIDPSVIAKFKTWAKSAASCLI